MGGTRGRHFNGINSKPRKVLENAPRSVPPPHLHWRAVPVWLRHFLPEIGCIIIPVIVRDAALGAGLKAFSILETETVILVIILFLFLLILRKRTPKRPKTPIWCSIVDAFQTPAVLDQEDYKLKHLAEQFRLADNLI